MRALLAAHVLSTQASGRVPILEAIRGGAHSPLGALAMALGVMLKLKWCSFCST